MEAPKTEGNQPEDGGWIEVPSKRSKKSKDAPAVQQHPQSPEETSHPRGGGGKYGDHQGGGARAPHHPAGRELTPEEEEKKKSWTAEEEELKAKVVLADDFDWSLGLALAKKSPEPTPAASPTSPSTWSKMLFPGGGKSQGPLVASKTTSDKPLSLIGGAHISLVKHDPKKKNQYAVAAFVVCAFPSLEVVYEVVKEVQLQEPFISGFYSFRDVGTLVSLFNELKEAKPDLVPQLILVDGPGINYRGFGLATHLGVLLGIPTVGVTKKFFSVDGLTENYVRKFLSQELQKRGEAIEIIGRNSGNVLGAGMRTTDGPRGTHVYISIGHRVSLPTAVEVVREASTGKLPQPIHSAQYLVKQELLKLDPKPKNLQGNVGNKGGNVRRLGNNREGGNNNARREGGGFRKEGNRREGGKNAGGLANGKAGSPPDDKRGPRGPRGPRPQGDGGQGQGNKGPARGPRPQHEQGQLQGRPGQGKGKGGNKGSPHPRGPGGQQGNQQPQQGAPQQGNNQPPHGNNQQGGKRAGAPRNHNRGNSPKQGNVWAQKVPSPAPAGGAPSAQPAAASQPQQAAAPAPTSGDQQQHRPAGSGRGGKQGGSKREGQQKQAQSTPAGEKGEEKAQSVQKEAQPSAEKKD